jgi:hypothetical protein
MALDPKQPWESEDAEAEDGRLILETLAATISATQGKVAWFSDGEAAMVLRVRRIAPDLDPYRAWTLAVLFSNRAAQKRDTKDLDHYLGFAPWRGQENRIRYEVAIRNGCIKRVREWPETFGFFTPELAKDVQSAIHLAQVAEEAVRLYKQANASPAIVLLTELAQSPSVEKVKAVIPLLTGMGRDEVVALQTAVDEFQKEGLPNQKQALKRSISVRVGMLKAKVPDPMVAVMEGINAFKNVEGIELQLSPDEVKALIDDWGIEDSKKARRPKYQCERCKKPIDKPDFTAAERFCPECSKVVKENRRLARKGGKV